MARITFSRDYVPPYRKFTSLPARAIVARALLSSQLLPLPPLLLHDATSPPTQQFLSHPPAWVAPSPPTPSTPPSPPWRPWRGICPNRSASPQDWSEQSAPDLRACFSPPRLLLSGIANRGRCVHSTSIHQNAARAKPLHAQKASQPSRGHGARETLQPASHRTPAPKS